MGFEPTTSTLARLRSTPELRPHRDKPGARYVTERGDIYGISVILQVPSANYHDRLPHIGNPH